MPIKPRERNMYDDPYEVNTPQYDQTIFFLACVSNVALVLFRYNVGFRILQPWIYRLHMVLLLLIGFWRLTKPGATEAAQIDGICLMFLSVIIAGKFWSLRAKAQKMALDPNNPLHTRSRGNSNMTKNMRLRVSEITVQRWIEPLVLFGIGAWCVELHIFVFGFYLAVVGSSLAMVEAHVLKEYNMRILDMQDATAEAHGYQQTVPTLKPKQENVQAPQANLIGSAVASISPELDRLRKGASNRRK